MQKPRHIRRGHQLTHVGGAGIHDDLCVDTGGVLCQIQGQLVAENGLGGRDRRGEAQLHEEVDDGQGHGGLCDTDVFLHSYDGLLDK